jgi:hypothetical protein
MKMIERKGPVSLGHLVRITSKVDDFYPNLVGKMGVILSVDKCPEDQSDQCREYTILFDQDQVKIKNFHRESTVPIDGGNINETIFTDEEMFTILWYNGEKPNVI